MDGRRVGMEEEKLQGMEDMLGVRVEEKNGEKEFGSK